MNKKFEAIIFDLDGTLIDSMNIWKELDISFLNKRGISVPENLFEDLQTNSIKDLAVYFKNRFSLPESTEEIISEWIEEVKHFYESKLHLKPDCLDFLKYLKDKNNCLAVGTSNELNLTNSVLKANNVFDYFQTIVTGCAVLKGKPEPDIYLQVAKNLNVNPKKCLVFEDSWFGVLSAKNANMTVFAIADDFSLPEKDLIIQNSDKYFYDYSEIFTYFKQLTGG